LPFQKMKFRLVILFTATVLLACKKEDDKAPQEPEPVKTGMLVVTAEAYDSLGTPSSGNDGLKVTLNTGQSATTSAAGTVTFSPLPYGTYAPVIFKNGYEGAPVGVNLVTPAQSVVIPIVQRSPFVAGSLSGESNNAGQVLISFSLSKSLPAGRSCQIAVFADTVSAVSGSRYLAADSTRISSTHVVSLNIAQSVGIHDFVNSLREDQDFYIMVVPVSYGLYNSSLFGRKVPLGANFYPSASVRITKNWIH
jgi:hypothetical protein